MEQARREPPGLNTWDCKTCRAHKIDRTRGCALHRASLRVRELGRLSRDEIVSLLDWDEPLQSLGAEGGAPEFVDTEGRMICPTGLIVQDGGIRRIIAMEADAREYGAGLPKTAWAQSVYRVLRATRAEIQDKADARRKELETRAADLNRQVGRRR